MNCSSMIEALGSGRPLLLDGGMGTTMCEQSLTASEAHEAFLAAGAEIITADTVAIASALTGEKTRQMLAEIRGRVQAALDARSRYLTNHPGALSGWLAASGRFRLDLRVVFPMRCRFTGVWQTRWPRPAPTLS